MFAECESTTNTFNIDELWSCFQILIKISLTLKTSFVSTVFIQKTSTV